jgi:glycosyltransferase involved in cell wall biosynthesis
MRPGAGDYVLVPEQLAVQALRMWPDVRKVIFNQNAYDTFTDHRPGPGEFETPYRHRDFVATLVVSEDSQQYLTYAFPDHRVFRIHYGIDPQLFGYESEKKPQIACMSRKNGKDVLQVFSLLKARNAIEGFRLFGIQHMTEAQTALQLRESMVFLSFGGPEGFGLPPAEAMACGCVVVGYHGRGGREFMKPQYTFPVEFGDVIGYAQVTEEVIRRLREDPQPLRDQARRASEFIHETYSPQREANDIVNTWREILMLSGTGA